MLSSEHDVVTPLMNLDQLWSLAEAVKILAQMRLMLSSPQFLLKRYWQLTAGGGGAVRII